MGRLGAPHSAKFESNGKPTPVMMSTLPKFQKIKKTNGQTKFIQLISKFIYYYKNISA